MAKAKKKSASESLQNMVRSGSKQARKTARARRVAPKKDGLTRLLELVQEHGKTTQNIPIHLIAMDENVRRSYNDAALEVLAKSLKHDGLIQAPSLCIKETPDGLRLICRNGHRRILAAQKLGWENIEASVISLDSASDELYHTINANLSEDVFYLDLALAYEQAHRLGDSDELIAERVGVNPRTVGWYRRLAFMPDSCQELARKHSDLFTATWAIQLARKGPLPQETLLLARMKEKIAGIQRQGATANDDQNKKPDVQEKKRARQSFKLQLESLDGEKAVQYRQLFEQLQFCGYISSATLARLQKQLTKPQTHSKAKRKVRSSADI